MKIFPEFTRPSLPRRSMYCLDFGFVSLHEDVVIPRGGGTDGGSARKNIKLPAHNMQTFYFA